MASMRYKINKILVWIIDVSNAIVYLFEFNNNKLKLRHLRVKILILLQDIYSYLYL